MVKAKEVNIIDSITPTEEKVAVTKTRRELAKEKMDKLIKEETRMVKGRFIAKESPGTRMKVTVRKYPGIPMFDQWMSDGEEYTIPLYVARHLNGIDVSAEHIDGKLNTCSYPIHGFKWTGGLPPPSEMGAGPNGEAGVPVPLIGVAKRMRRFAFESTDFERMAG